MLLVGLLLALFILAVGFKMPYDEKLFKKIAELLINTKGIEPKKMFGGICFLHQGNMLCGIDGKRLMVRVGADQHEYALSLKHAKIMDITGRPMKGFIFVEEAGYKTTSALSKWVDLGLKFTSTLPPKKTKKKIK